MRIKDQEMYVQQVLCTHTCTVYVLFTANENEGSGCVCTASTMYTICTVHELFTANGNEGSVYVQYRHCSRTDDGANGSSEIGNRVFYLDQLDE
jgi:hypothetical protein